jgi:hypothetical protein
MKELRNKRLLEVATYETEGFSVTEGGTTRAYAKTTTKDAQGFDSAKWKRNSPDAKDLETTKVEDALFKVGGIEVAEFLDQPKGPEAYGLDAPVFSLLVRSGGQASRRSTSGRRTARSTRAARATPRYSSSTRPRRTSSSRRSASYSPSPQRHKEHKGRRSRASSKSVLRVLCAFVVVRSSGWRRAGAAASRAAGG